MLPGSRILCRWAGHVISSDQWSVCAEACTQSFRAFLVIVSGWRLNDRTFIILGSRRSQETSMQAPCAEMGLEL